MINLIFKFFLYLPKENKERQQFQRARESSQHFLGAPVDAMSCYILGNENSDAGHNVHAGRRFPSCNLCFLVIDRNDLEMAEKIKSFRSKCSATSQRIKHPATSAIRNWCIRTVQHIWFRCAFDQT